MINLDYTHSLASNSFLTESFLFERFHIVLLPLWALSADDNLVSCISAHCKMC